mgnify:CR=1 FL=1
MKSGLEGRNNASGPHNGGFVYDVSMKSGLEGRNNPMKCVSAITGQAMSQ